MNSLMVRKERMSSKVKPIAQYVSVQFEITNTNRYLIYIVSVQ